MQPREDLRVVGLPPVLETGAEDDLPFLPPDLCPQMVETVRLDNVLEVVREMIVVAVEELVLPEPFSRRPKPDPRLRDDPELALATPHGIEKSRVPIG